MESLSETSWDVVISGTGLSQSLLALALSRSGKKILHVDKNDYYGGAEAALSLQEAEDWVKKVNKESSGHSTFSNASLFLKAESQDPSASEAQLSFPRAYSLTLSPQLIYTQSALIPILVSSKVYRQLEFQAMGSWWICRSMPIEPEDAADSEEVREPPKKQRKAVLQRVPNGREDLIPDTSIDFRAKMALVKFLNAVAKPDEAPEVEEADSEVMLSDFLERNFRLPAPLHPAIHGISLSPGPVRSTPTKYALPRIRRHLRSIGVFGPGFGSVVPKWGCLAEVAQVACRAGAVGGAVYVLGRGIKTIRSLDQQAAKESGDSWPEGGGVEVELSDGEKIHTKWIAGSAEDLPEQPSKSDIPSRPESTRSITVVASALGDLFPTIAEGGPPPAGAVVVVPGDSEDTPPVYLLIHSADTGECPDGQSIIYASTSLPSHQDGHALLSTAITTLLEGEGHKSSNPPPPILWSLRYTQHTLSAPAVSSIRAALQTPSSPNGAILLYPPPSLDLVLEDSLLEDVRATWKAVMGPEAVEDEFMRFEERAMRGEEEEKEEGGSNAE